MLKRLATRSRSALLLGLVFLAAACGGSAAKSAATTDQAHSNPPAASSAPASSSRADATAVSSAANRDFGTILTDGAGRTLYFFDNDKPIKPQSSCTGQCVKAWPIVPASSANGVGPGVDAAKLGRIVRTDGQTQLTYNNWPLYTFSGDTAAGDTNGQGIGGIWHVVGVDGKPITNAVVQMSARSGAGY